MKGLIVAFKTELIKALKSRMLWGTIIFFSFIAVMLALLMLVARHPEIAVKSEVLDMKASLISKADWATYFGLLLQMVLTVGSLGPAIVAIWVFGREYSDRVIKDLLALPVSRYSIVSAKLLIVFFWSCLLLILLYAIGLISGLLIHLDGWNKELFLQKTQVYFMSAFLTVLLFPVIAFLTCMSRGYLLPVGIAILTLIVTQFVFIGFPGITPYFPWAIPGLYSGIAGPASPNPQGLSYIIIVLTSLTGIAGTALWWRYADHH